MSDLYITENGVHISLEANCIEVEDKEEICRHIPIETLESISIFSVC